MIKIAFIGPQASGKSSLAKKTHDICRRRGMKTILISEVADKCPYPINEESTVEAQRWIWFEQLRQEIVAQNEKPAAIICDRSLMDNMVYLASIGGDEAKELFAELYQVSHEWMRSYDAVVRMPLNLAWLQSGNNPKRSKNVDFAMRIDAIFTNLADRYANVEADDLLEMLQHVSTLKFGIGGDSL